MSDRLSFPVQATIRVPERLVLAGGGWRRIDLAVRFGIFERPGHGPVLVDAGWPVARHGDGMAARLYRLLLRARCDPAQSPLAALRARGHGPGDVAAILLSHLHADHLGALPDFPGVPILAPRAALHRARAAPLRALRHGVLPALLPDPTHVQDFGHDIHLPHDLGRGSDVLGDGSVLSVPLPGHADGHTGFLFPRLDPPVLYAADTQWLLPAIAANRPPRGPARLVHDAPHRVAESLARVDGFRRAGGRVVLCHDPGPAGPFP